MNILSSPTGAIRYLSGYSDKYLRYNRIRRLPVYILVIFLVACLFILEPWNLEWSEIIVNSGNGDVKSRIVSRSSGDVKSRIVSRSSSDDSNYIQDKNGYLYPKGYFEFARPGSAPTVKDMNLKGRHSDEVMPVCKNFTNGAGKHIDSVYDYRIDRFNCSKEFKNPCWYVKTEEDGMKLRCIPYFYFIGTPKAGSTDLYFRIAKHPDVTQCGAKERRFFDRERFVKASWSRFSYYLASYNKASQNIADRTESGVYNNMIFGDGSPTYMYNNVQWFRLPGNEGCVEPRITCMSYIHRMNPNAKLILIMRNPIDRLYSSYLYNWVRTGAARTPEEFHDWTTKAVNAHLDCFKKHPFRACLYSTEIIGHTVLTVAANIYSRLIMDVLKVFPREQLHVIKMEDYSVNMTTHLADVFNFLGLAPLPHKDLDEISQSKEQNKGPSYKVAGSMWPKTRKMLYDFYKPFNEELAYILNNDKYLWHEDI